MDSVRALIHVGRPNRALLQLKDLYRRKTPLPESEEARTLEYLVETLVQRLSANSASHTCREREHENDPQSDQVLLLLESWQELREGRMSRRARSSLLRFLACSSVRVVADLPGLEGGSLVRFTPATHALESWAQRLWDVVLGDPSFDPMEWCGLLFELPSNVPTDLVAFSASALASELSGTTTALGLVNVHALALQGGSDHAFVRSLWHAILMRIQWDEVEWSDEGEEGARGWLEWARGGDVPEPGPSRKGALIPVEAAFDDSRLSGHCQLARCLLELFPASAVSLIQHTFAGLARTAAELPYCVSASSHWLALCRLVRQVHCEPGGGMLAASSGEACEGLFRAWAAKEDRFRRLGAWTTMRVTLPLAVILRSALLTLLPEEGSAGNRAIILKDCVRLVECHPQVPTLPHPLRKLIGVTAPKRIVEDERSPQVRKAALRLAEASLQRGIASLSDVFPVILRGVEDAASNVRDVAFGILGEASYVQVCAAVPEGDFPSQWVTLLKRGLGRDSVTAASQATMTRLLRECLVCGLPSGGKKLVRHLAKQLPLCGGWETRALWEHTVDELLRGSKLDA